MQILDAIRQSFSSGDEMQITAYKENVKHLDHPRMWNVLGEEELKRGNFDDAEFAFVHSANYSALQFLNKQLKFIPPQLQEAEILAYLGDYINASKCYVTAKRLLVTYSNYLPDSLGNTCKLVDIFNLAEILPSKCGNNWTTHDKDVAFWQKLMVPEMRRMT